MIFAFFFSDHLPQLEKSRLLKDLVCKVEKVGIIMKPVIMVSSITLPVLKLNRNEGLHVSNISD